LTVIPGGNAQNHPGIKARSDNGGLGDIEDIHALGAQAFANFLARHLGVTGGAAIKQADIGTAHSCVTHCSIQVRDSSMGSRPLLASSTSGSPMRTAPSSPRA